MFDGQLSVLLMYLGVAAFTAAAVHNADVPDIKADRAAGVKTIAAAVGRENSLIVSAALAAVGTLAGVVTGCAWLAGVGPYAVLAISCIAAGWDDVGVMLDDSQGMVAGLLAALLV
jgi:4-hydroxybenzoate polyprenyltransferase